jgi:putative thioredoxin
MSETPAIPSSLSHVIEATSETFVREVIEASSTVPVVVDFWAPWCGPCRVLGPILEKLAGEYAGKFLLAKVNIDENPKLASQFGVRSIPTVFGVRDGAVADAFTGVQSESVIRTWINRLLPTEAELLAEEAHRLESTDRRAAESKYSHALALESELPQAQIGLVRIALAEGHFEDASARIAALERRGFLEPEAERLKAEVMLRGQAAGSKSVDSARAFAAAHPKDLNHKLALAEALAAAGQYAEALALCLDLVERDRKGVGEQARQVMVAVFRLLPAGDELLTEYQRQLSLLL